MIRSFFNRKNCSILTATISGLSLCIFLFVATACNKPAETSKKNSKSRKIVLIAGEPSHPSGQHEFNAGAIILARCLNEQSGLPVQVKVVHNGWPKDESVFNGADAIIVYSDGNAKHPVTGHEEVMNEMITNGMGLMCMHYGVEVPAGEQGEYFKKWFGGHYESGFSTNPHWTADAKLDSTHPIGNGVPDFTANDEWYYNIRFAQPGTARDILTAIPTRDRINRYIHWTPDGEKGLGKKQTMMWAVERPDGGRGVGFTGGHWHRNWAIDDFRRAVLNAIFWTAGGEVPANGITSDSVSEEALNQNLDKKKKMEHISLPGDVDLNQPAAKPVEFKWPGKK